MSDNMKALIGLLVFSAIIFLVGGSLGIYASSVDQDERIHMEYRPPAGDRRW